MTENVRNFIKEHAEDDVFQLVLRASHDKDMDIRFVAEQIAVRRQVKDKLPLWYANDCLVYPSALAVEQCSSELAATYKQRFVNAGDSVFDLTGGLGVDAYYLSRKARKVTYVERNAEYCAAAVYNMKRLGAHNVGILNRDVMDLIVGNAGWTAESNEQTAAGAELLSAANVFYLDPARRGAGNRRLFALEDCEPDLTQLWPLLRGKQGKIIVKLSPMLDISQTLSRLPGVAEVHVVSIKNDCKELLVISPPGQSEVGVKICCVNFAFPGGEQSFWFNCDEEKTAVVSYAEMIDRYLYEPNASILKAGAYKTVASRYGLKKLHVSSHLYTSGTYVPSFAGRIFEVINAYQFDNRLCRNLSAQIPQANISVRNFPLSVDELRRRTRIADGGDVYLFATTLSGNQKVVIDCRKVFL